MTAVTTKKNIVILYTLHGSSYISIEDLKKSPDGRFSNKVYINLTNKCPCACTFCLRNTKEMTTENTLWLKREPLVEEVIDELKKYNFEDTPEFVFCGFGEPMERAEDIIKIAKFIKSILPDKPIRINTNGLGNLLNKEDILAKMKGLIDTVSISLNAPTKEEYLEITRSRFGIGSFQAMLDFAVEAKKSIPNVIFTVVEIIGAEKIAQCQKICDNIGVPLRVRPLE
ncbi:MAG: TatD family nuclease-associated radical SAM protein [Eubacterium sp.]